MATMPALSGYASPQEIAQYSSLSLKSVRRLYQSGQLASQRINRRILIRWEDAEALIRRSLRTLSPTSRPAPSSLDRSGRALTFAPAEAHQRARLGLSALDGLNADDSDESDQAETLSELEANLRFDREGDTFAATG